MSFEEGGGGRQRENKSRGELVYVTGNCLAKGDEPRTGA